MSKPRVHMLLKMQIQVALTKAMTEFRHVPRRHEATRDQEATRGQGVNGLMPKTSSSSRICKQALETEVAAARARPIVLIGTRSLGDLRASLEVGAK